MCALPISWKTRSRNAGPRRDTGPLRPAGALRRGGVDADARSVGALAFELHHPADLREQGVVAAAPDVEPRVEFGPALTHQNGAGRHHLAAEPLHAQPLRVALPPIPRRTLSLFMRHG